MGDFWGLIFKTGAQNVVSRTFGTPYLKIYLCFSFATSASLLHIFAGCQIDETWYAMHRARPRVD